MLNNKECFIFRDLYAAYLDEEVEEETSEWMKLHLAECEECKSWAESFNKEEEKGYEDKELSSEVSEYEDDNEKRIIERAKILLITSLVVVVILAVWMSLWIFA